MKYLNFIFLFILATDGLFAFDDELRLIESSRSYLIYEFKPKFIEKKITIDGKEFLFPTFFNCSAQQESDSGLADLRFRSFPLDLNSKSGNIITIIESEFEITPNYKIAFVPKYEIKNGSIQKKYLIKSFKDEKKEIVEISNAFDYQNKLIGFVKVNPLHFDVQTSTLKKYTKIIFKIELSNETHIKSSLNIANQKSLFADGDWWKFEITEDGLYKIDVSLLKKIGITPANISSIFDIAIFGGDGKILPTQLSSPRKTENQQLPLKYVDNNNNNKFDDDDYILFFAKGVLGWDYSSLEKTFSHYTNPYTNTNYYFLRIQPQQNPKIIQTKNIIGSPQNYLTQTIGKIFFDEEKANVTQSGLEWFSSPMNPNDSKVYSAKLNGYTLNTQIFYNTKVFARSNVNSTFTIDESGKNIGTITIPFMNDYEINGDPIGEYARPAIEKYSLLPILNDDRTVLKFNYKASSNVATGYIDFVEMFYTQTLRATNDILNFSSPDTSGEIKYFISSFSKNSILVFDATDIFSTSLITTNTEQQLGTFTFIDENTSNQIKTYWASTVDVAQTISSAIKIPNFDLRSNNLSSDFVIFTHRDFLSEAKRLKSHKESLPIDEKLTTTIIEMDSLYNDFSFGMPDPVSMRDYLAFARKNWTIKPKHVLFFGDASYDFKGILKNDKNFVPSFETANSNLQIATYNYDDFFCGLDSLNSGIVSLSNGRLTARTLNDAKHFVDRIIAYEKNFLFGNWKNLITIVSDDHNVNNSIDGAPNEDQSEILSNDFVPQSYDVKKIFIGDYPTLLTSSGRRKPEARQAIINQINDGTLVMNYIGHGNPKVWAHESVLTKDDVESQLTNEKNLPLIVAATCDWGRFDEAGQSSSGEEVILNRDGGAIGVISATRVVWSGDNAATNYMLYKYLFPINPFDKTPRLGDALALAKNDPSSGSTENNQKYHLLGDPTLRLAIPKLVFTVDSINGKKISNNLFDTLRPLSKVTITGSVKNSIGQIQNQFSGTSLLTIYDAFRFKTISDLGIDFTFKQNGAVIFKGENSIKNGILNSSFIVPKDISYEKNNGRLSLYFVTDSSDGRGFSTNFMIGGDAVSTIIDKTGPNIFAYFDNKNFKSSDVLGSAPKLFIELTDSSGINSTGSGIGHRIEAWLDNNSSSFDLTEFYRGKKDTYQEGIIEYQMNDLANGEHILKIKAWDTYNNSSTTEINFRIATSNELKIKDLFAIPNPMKNFTHFTFQQNQTSAVDVKIKIYTINGRLIQTLEEFALMDHFIKIPWNGLDADGDEIGNGVYLFNVEAKTIDGKYSSSSIGKLVIAK